MEATQTYKYTALSGPRVIRVLRLSGDSADNLFAELIETNLGHACSYEAISYVWGSDNKSHNLNLRGGSLIKITESLYHALKDIRYSAIEDGPRHLWADGVCINQEDIDERSQQVGLMAEIYGSALKVITYVGQDTSDVKKGIKLAKTLVAAHEESRRSSVNKSNARRQITGDADPAWPALRDFLGRTWYTRMWIIQETVLNRNGVIVCGRIEIPWDLMLKLCNMLTHCVYNEHFRITPYSEKQIGAMGWWMIELRKTYRKHPNGNPLLQLLTGSREFNCSEPVDHVFAVSSLMEKSCRIKPNYKESLRCVYIEAAEQIRESCGLLVLSYAGMWKKQGVPSWVPDWSFYPKQIPIFQSRWFNSLWFWFDGLSFYVMRHIYVHADVKTGQLRLSGCIFDRVVHVGGTLRKSFITARLERHKWAQTHYSLLTRSGTKYVGGGTSREAFWRTLILDLDPEKRFQHHSALPASGAYFESYVRPNKLWARKEALESIKEYDPNNSPKPPAIEPVVMEAWKRESKLDPTECGKDKGEHNVFRSLRPKDSPQGSSSQGSEYRDLVLKAQNLYREFFMTEKGYIGMSAQGVGVGDLVTFLPSARVPFLLRRTTSRSTYSLVGDCYIHRMMNGEVLKDGNWNVSLITLV
uniref:Heterokaryon incompatibility domain-containing protein n=1 Tax=Bionectria ochroleuca TaxID=29856 RepID=A0A8H7NQW4_BIOOC